MRLSKAGTLGPLNRVSWTPRHQPEGESQWGSGQQDLPGPTQPPGSHRRDTHFPVVGGLWPMHIEEVSLHEEFTPIPTLHYFQAQTWSVSLTVSDLPRSHVREMRISKPEFQQESFCGGQRQANETVVFKAPSVAAVTPLHHMEFSLPSPICSLSTSMLEICDLLV